MMRRSMSMAGLGATLVLALGAAGCGSSATKTGNGPNIVVKDPWRLIAATADATSHAKTAKVDIAASMQGSGLPRAISFDMNGVIALDGSAADFTMNLANIVPNAPAGARVEAREVGGVMYMDFGSMMRAIAGSDAAAVPGLGNIKWVKIDLRGLTNSGSTSSPAGFTQYLQYLRGVSKNGVQTVGHETVRGVETTHFRADIDLSKSIAAMRQMLNKLSPGTRSLLEQGINALKGVTSPMTADVWIDAQGLTRRLEMHMPFPVPGAGSHAEMQMTMDLYDFGVPVNVQPPPSSQVQDLSNLANLAGGLGSGTSS